MPLTPQSQELLDKLKTAGYTPETDEIYGTSDVGMNLFVQHLTALKEEIESDKAAGWPPCYVQCILDYLQCIRNNPTYPPRVICDTYLNNCIPRCDNTPPPQA